LSPVEARDRMTALLNDSRYYRTQRSPVIDSEDQLLIQLPPSARSLFAEFAVVEECYGDTRLSRSLIGPSALAPSLTRIGYGIAGTELVIQLTGETVFRIDGSEKRIEEIEHFASIWHYLLFMAMIIYPE